MRCYVREAILSALRKTRACLTNTRFLIPLLSLLSWQLAAFSQEPRFHIFTSSKGELEIVFQLPQTNDEGDLTVKYTFAPAKGLLGPSSAPSDQSGFRNLQGTIFGITYQPVTKSAFVKLFVLRSGDLIFVNKVNAKVASLLSSPWSEDARYFLRIEYIKGDLVHLETEDFDSGRISRFNVLVTSDGSISRAR